MAAAIMMDNRKRPLEDASALSADSPSKRMQLASSSTHNVNGAHAQLAKSHASRQGDESDDEEQIPAYKGLEVSDIDGRYANHPESMLTSILIPGHHLYNNAATSAGLSQGSNLSANARIEKRLQPSRSKDQKPSEYAGQHRESH